MKREDRICLKGIQADCIIGVLPVERRERQRVDLELELYCDLSRSGATDDIADTLDYKELRDRVVSCIENSRDHLIERLAQRVASCCLEFRLVSEVVVRLAKPAALTGVRQVSVAIRRSR